MTDHKAERAMSDPADREQREEIINGDRYCAKCGEFLGAVCDPFGRSECGEGCFDEDSSDE